MNTTHLTAKEIAAIAENPTRVTSEQQQHLEECPECREWSISLREVWSLLHSAEARSAMVEAEDLEICPWSEQTMATARKTVQNRTVPLLLQRHLATCEACRELYTLTLDIEREASATVVQDHLQRVLDRLTEYYGRALVTVHTLLPMVAEPVYRSSAGAEPRRFTLKVSEDMPFMSITLQEQSENHRYSVQIEPPGASVDVFAADGRLLASYDQGTTQIFASAITAYLVLQSKHFVQLTSELK